LKAIVKQINLHHSFKSDFAAYSLTDRVIVLDI